MVKTALVVVVVALVLMAPTAAFAQVTDAQKTAFIELLKKLPTKGEFYTDEAVTKAEPHLPVLFALTETDLAGLDIYPFGALSRGLADRPTAQRYAVQHFGDIRHPELKLLWASMLFDERRASADIVRFLRAALESEPQAKLLAEMTGPNFARLKKRIVNAANPPADIIDRLIAAEAERLRGAEFEEVRVVKRTGLTDPGSIAVVVLYTIEGMDGGNGYIQFLVAFVNGARGLRPTRPVSAGGKLFRAAELVEVQGYTIALKTKGYAKTDAACCPSVEGATSYRLTDGKLVEVGGSGRRQR